MCLSNVSPTRRVRRAEFDPLCHLGPSSLAPRPEDGPFSSTASLLLSPIWELAVSTAQRAIRQARALSPDVVQEHRHAGQSSLTNIIRIIDSG
jgi:hypothetical protein